MGSSCTSHRSADDAAVQCRCYHNLLCHPQLSEFLMGFLRTSDLKPLRAVNSQVAVAVDIFFLGQVRELLMSQFFHTQQKLPMKQVLEIERGLNWTVKLGHSGRLGEPLQDVVQDVLATLREEKHFSITLKRSHQLCLLTQPPPKRIQRGVELGPNSVWINETNCSGLWGRAYHFLPSVWITAIPKGCLRSCLALSHVVLQDCGHVTSIGDEFLYSCHNLKTVDLSGLNNVECIGEKFMTSCYQIVSVDLSAFSKVKIVGGWFLCFCNLLKNLDLSPLVSLEEIGDRFIDDCCSLPGGSKLVRTLPGGGKGLRMPIQQQQRWSHEDR